MNIVGGRLMQCKFEEKQYEQPLNYELAWRRNVIPAGQVFENSVAIDAAIFSRNPKFWDLWKTAGSTSAWRSGLILTPELWDNVERKLNEADFPKFKFNLLVQHKRPEYIKSRAGSEYSYWNQPYFRYDLEQDQQGILYTLEKRVSSEAIVVYACPSFWTKKELFKFMHGSKLVENSNFVQPSILQGHKRYAFVAAGNIGRPFSEPTETSSFNLLAEIDKRFQMNLAFDNNTQFLRKFAATVRATIKESGDRIQEDFLSVEKAIGLPEHEFGSAVVTVLTFAYFTATSWLIGYAISHAAVANNYEENGRIKAFVRNLKEMNK
jgi:hypothetical protein